MQTSEALRAYYSRVVPVIPELFNMAYAICGSYDLAEYALQYTLMEAWIGESHGGMGFREGLRNTLRRVAVEAVLEPRAEHEELTWNGLSEERGDYVLALIAQESAEMRRLIALRYGCGLSAGRMARLTGVPAGRVRELLERFERRVYRRLPPSDRRRLDSILARTVRREFGRQSEEMPSLSAIYRTFESEAAETRRPNHLTARIARRAVCAALALLCAAAFWFAAALIRPMPVQPEPQEQVTEAAPEVKTQ